MIDMNSDQVYAAIEKIAQTASKNEKEALVKQFLQFPLFQRVCVAAYNPFITYGIAKVPPRDTEKYAPGSSVFGVALWDMLLALEKRTLTGNAARDEVNRWIHLLSPESSELLRRILKKDLRAGFTGNTVNRAVKGLIPDQPYMRCSLPKDAKLHTWPWAEGVFSQEKADGMFSNTDYDSAGIVTITSREGRPFPLDTGAFDEIVAQVQATFPRGTQTHGELLVEVAGGILPREISNGIMNHVSAGGELDAGQRIVLYAWDQIPLSEAKPKGKVETPYKERFKALATQLIDLAARENGRPALRIIRTKLVRSLAEAYKHYAEFLAQGKEGTIVKHPAGIWKDSSSGSKELVKLKLEVDVDLKVVGFVPGEGKNAATFGSITCRTSDGLLEVNVSGMTDAMRKDIHERREQVIGNIITVKANSIMKPSDSSELHSLFLPRFVELRTDKSEADSLERVKEQFDNAVKAVAA